MPRVPQRKLSYGENLNKLRTNRAVFCGFGTKDVPLSEESRTKLDGLVRTIKQSSLPHALKCADCEYIASSVADSKMHRFDEH